MTDHFDPDDADALFAAADPIAGREPNPVLLAEARHELLGEIMSSETSTKRRTPWLVAAAAAVVLAVAAGGFLIANGEGSGSPQEAAAEPSTALDPTRESTSDQGDQTSAAAAASGRSRSDCFATGAKENVELVAVSQRRTLSAALKELGRQPKGACTALLVRKGRTWYEIEGKKQVALKPGDPLLNFVESSKFGAVRGFVLVYVSESKGKAPGRPTPPPTAPPTPTPPPTKPGADKSAPLQPTPSS